MRILFFISLFFLAQNSLAQTIRVALLPIPDALPFYLAEDKKLFEKEGLSVKGIHVSSAFERDQLMQAGKIDGMISDLTGTASFNREKSKLKIVQIARKPMGQSPLFRFIAKPGSNKQSLKEFKKADIGISKHSVIEYLAERMLENAGVEDSRMHSIPAISERFQLLMQKRLDLALMPDPLAFTAIQEGAIEVANDLEASFYSLSVLSFDTDFILREEEKIKSFFRAWNKAAELINKDPEKYRDIFVKRVRMSPKIRDIFPIPPYPIEDLPSEKQWEDMNKWMLEKNLLEKKAEYKDNIAPFFLDRETEDSKS